MNETGRVLEGMSYYDVIAWDDELENVVNVRLSRDRKEVTFELSDRSGDQVRSAELDIETLRNFGKALIRLADSSDVEG